MNREDGEWFAEGMKVTVECVCVCGCDWKGRRVAIGARIYKGGLGDKCPRCSDLRNRRMCEAADGAGEGKVIERGVPRGESTR